MDACRKSEWMNRAHTSMCKTHIVVTLRQFIISDGNEWSTKLKLFSMPSERLFFTHRHTHVWTHAHITVVSQNFTCGSCTCVLRTAWRKRSQNRSNEKNTRMKVTRMIWNINGVRASLSYFWIYLFDGFANDHRDDNIDYLLIRALACSIVFYSFVIISKH